MPKFIIIAYTNGNEEVYENLRLGGVSALILALVASICLAVVPQNLTNEYENTDGVTHAATEVIDGVTYQVFYLTGDHTANLSKIAECNKNTSGNYRYVMQDNWTYSETQRYNIELDGDSVIFDLNGYTLTICPNDEDPRQGAVCFKSRIGEVTDSSATQSGQVIAGITKYMPVFAASRQTLIISGGTCTNASIHVYMADVYFCGGNYTGNATNNANGNYEGERKSPIFLLGKGQKVTVAPYIYKETRASDGVISYKSYDYYAVSTTPYATGIYNYAYGLTWEINVGQLRKLAIPADKTYYLWGRNKDGAYQYLNCVYIDGKWQAVAA